MNSKADQATTNLARQRDSVCPSCGAAWSEQELVGSSYRCDRCDLQLAHVETSPVGKIRRLGWLRQPGDVVVERYRVEKVLGKGGFAATYLVEDLRLSGKKRALKEVPKSLYDDTETEILSHLNHPSIPDITDRAEADGMMYLAMEFGGGRTLESERRAWGGRVPAATLLPWLRQLGEVLSYLHSQTSPIIHRDLKPDNVLLDEHDRIMLIDFGIAKQSQEGGQTRTIGRAATHGYSPPEQALGTGTDPRSDVYAMAATAYALLTGQAPAPAHERVAGRELEPPAQLVPDLPTRISDALIQALNLNINLRPATISQLVGALEGEAQGSPSAATEHTVRVDDLSAEYAQKATSVRVRSERVTVTPASAHTRPKRTPTWLWATLGVLLAGVGAGAFWGLQGDNPDKIAQPAGKTSEPVAVDREQSTHSPDTTVGVDPDLPDPDLPEKDQSTATPVVPTESASIRQNAGVAVTTTSVMDGEPAAVPTKTDPMEPQQPGLSSSQPRSLDVVVIKDSRPVAPSPTPKPQDQNTAPKTSALAAFEAAIKEREASTPVTDDSSAAQPEEPTEEKTEPVNTVQIVAGKGGRPSMPASSDAVRGRCNNLVLKAQLGEPLSSANRRFLKRQCR